MLGGRVKTLHPAVHGGILSRRTPQHLDELAQHGIDHLHIGAMSIYEDQAIERKVLLPVGNWYDFYTGEFIEGGQTKEVNAPYERMPMYAPAGAIITAGPEIQYTTEKKPELITVYVYTGDNGEFKLYEDENTNYNYEEGKFSTIPFTYNNQNKTLTIGNREGSFNEMLEERRFEVVFVSPDKSVGFNPDAANGQLVDYSGQAVEVVFE